MKWLQDKVLVRVIRNTGYLFSSQSIGMILSTLQGILAAVLLGPSSYGALGVIILFASSVNRLLSFRMGEVVVKYAGQALALGQRERAAAVIKAAGLTEAVTSVVAYGLLVLLSPLAAVYIVKDPAATTWIIFYGLALLANLMTETASAVLQISDHFRIQALINLISSALTAGLILLAFILHGGVEAVLIAYLLGKLVSGVGPMLAAYRRLEPLLGEGWLNTPLNLLHDRTAIARFAISTNLSGTINLVIRDSEVLWVGFFLSTLQAGYFKFALAVMNIVLMPINPFIATTFPEISRSVAEKKWSVLQTLLKRTSWIAFIWTMSVVVGLMLLGQPFLIWLKGGAYLPSYPAILILVAGYGFANIFFWNRPLLLAFGRPNFPLLVTFLVGVVKTALMYILVPRFGFLAQAWLLSGYFILSVGIIVWRCQREISQAKLGGDL
ncbi:MAG: oligosaccharide flippase family protein [Anaerolineales bacterium]